MSIENRYTDIFGIRFNTENVPPTNIPQYTIKDRESDIFITFKAGDRLDLISNKFYGSSSYWWVILGANRYDIEFDIEYGTILRVPYPLDEVLIEIRGKVT